MKDFSVFNRGHFLATLSSKVLDLLVIGGGITGAGIALDAASRGLSVGLVEKQDFASGTSSRSTKLIHGGLRYLKQGEFGLVRESGRERAILHKNAPHLVKAEKMILPILQGGSFGWVSASLGTWIYDRLAGVRGEERRKILSREETLREEPLLDRAGLKGSALFYEYRTDDARLTLEVIRTAHAHGALCVNYASADSFLYDGKGNICGAQVHDLLEGKGYEIRAKTVVNAAGAWVDELRKREGPLAGKRLRLTKGVHLVFAKSKIPLRSSVYFDSLQNDGRMIFAIPRENSVYIGTTDTDYSGPIENPQVSDGDIQYLLNAANAFFTNINLTNQDVRSSWAGVRPLIQEDGKKPSEVSRKDEIFISGSGLLSIAGGKLTGYRKMAERVVDLLTSSRCRTLNIPLAVGETEPLALSAKDPKILADAVGRSLRHEMTARLSDFLVRRTGLAYFEPETARELARPVLDLMADELRWNAEQKERELNFFQG